MLYHTCALLNIVSKGGLGILCTAGDSINIPGYFMALPKDRVGQEWQEWQNLGTAFSDRMVNAVRYRQL